MSLTVKLEEGVRFTIQSGTHTIHTDQPVEDGGTDTGMSPVDLFVGSLGSCIAYFVARYCARHGLPLDGFTTEVDWSMAEQPHRVGSVTVRLHLPADLTSSHQEKLLKVAHGCTVHQSVLVPPKVEISVNPRLCP